MDINSITVTIDENGAATLSGLPYNTLRSVITAASLHRSQRGPDLSPVRGLSGDRADEVHGYNLSAYIWWIEQQLVLDTIFARIQNAISPEYSNISTAGLEEEHRRRLAHIEGLVRGAEDALKPPVKDLLDDVRVALHDARKAIDAAAAVVGKN